MDDEYEDDISGSDADISGESSDTSSNKDEDETVDKVFIKWLAPGGPADQAGLMKGILPLKPIVTAKIKTYTKLIPKEV